MALGDVWDLFTGDVRSGLADLVGGMTRSAARAAREEAEAFLAETRENLERWADMVLAGTLTRDEFDFLVRGQMGLWEMRVLVRKEKVKSRVAAFRNDLAGLLVRAALRAVLPF
jgi:hypothetical protein